MADESPYAACLLLVRELEKRVEQRFKLDDVQRVALKEDMDRRLEDMNQFRTQISNERRQFITFDTADARFANIDGRYNLVLDRVAKLEGWQQRLLGIGIVLALAMGVIGVVLGRVFK